MESRSHGRLVCSDALHTLNAKVMTPSVLFPGATKSVTIRLEVTKFTYLSLAFVSLLS